MSGRSFGHWFPLANALESAPPSSGVFQIKIPVGLISYPTGKSAMIYYAASENLQKDLGEFARQHVGREWRARYMELPTELANALLETILEAFESRFGEKPRFP